ncbi:MAG: MSCRAMM family adhesin SdrC [Myxococcota bacterium]|nr:MSCRAMM family adhesin SdrC [Myxococcota bacterium]
MRDFSSWIGLVMLCGVAAIGCAPQIGDSCSNSSNCSINGDRLCDTAQPGGYCTIFDCQPDRCPDQSVCVRFNPQPSRRAILACMRACNGDGDCRGEYRCASPEELMETGLEAEVIDTARGPRFCVARVDPTEIVDAGGVDATIDPMIDAGTDAGADAGTDAGSDAGSDAGTAPDAGGDSGSGADASSDAAIDAGTDAG